MAGGGRPQRPPSCHKQAAPGVIGVMTLEGGLIERARAGDLAAFDALVSPLIVPASQLACVILRDWHEAEDAVQEATFKAWRALGKLQDKTTSLRPWFLTIVANEARSRRRGRWWTVIRLADPVSDSVGPSPEEQAAQSIDLERAMRRLTEPERLILFMHFYLDLPPDEIGRVMGMSPEAVRSRMYRATRSMRPALRYQEKV